MKKNKLFKIVLTIIFMLTIMFVSESIIYAETLTIDSNDDEMYNIVNGILAAKHLLEVENLEGEEYNENLANYIANICGNKERINNLKNTYVLSESGKTLTVPSDIINLAIEKVEEKNNAEQANTNSDNTSESGNITSEPNKEGFGRNYK